MSWEEVSHKVVMGREKGAAHISIATSLALEGLFGFGEFEGEKRQDGKIKELWVNLRTLFRNFYGSLDKNEKENLTTQSLIDGLIEDIHILTQIVEQKTATLVKVKFYYCTYKSFKKIFPKAKYKELKTAKQLFEQGLEDKVLGELIKFLEEEGSLYNFKQYDIIFSPGNPNTALLTHYAADLLWRNKFTNLYLLESHTGKLKGKEMWYTKITGGKNNPRLPFNKLTLQVFGDNNNLFASMPPTIKNRIMEVAEKDKWSNVSTEERVRVSINRIPYPEEKRMLLEFLN